VTDDWFDLLAALLDAGVRFLVVGAHAMAAHGVPRGTQDLDVLVDPTPDNAGRVWRALAAFGAPLDQLGLSLASFESAWQGRMIVTIRGREVPVLGRAALIANKRASGRPKDLADLHALGEA
jgi:hypothetical protein